LTVKNYFLPHSASEAAGLLAEYGPAILLISGGTIAMPLINEGISMPEYVLGLRQAGLNTLHRSNGSLAIGATTTLSQMQAQRDIPMLAAAAHNVGGWAVRNMGTAGGNLFAPPPAGDFATALLALDARVKLVSKTGARSLPLVDFYTGFMLTALQPGELVVEIEAPLPLGKTSYIKYGRRHANTPAVVTVAAQIWLEGYRVQQARIALNAAGPYPLRATQAEKALVGAALNAASIAAAADAAALECQPFTDAVASEWYRRKMVAVYVRRALEQIAA
jgi:CO/xanthine dehydrogenase FAD-binding subunit